MTYQVVIIVDDGRTETVTIEAANEWKARTAAMMVASLKLTGQGVTYVVTEVR